MRLYQPEKRIGVVKLVFAANKIWCCVDFIAVCDFPEIFARKFLVHILFLVVIVVHHYVDRLRLCRGRRRTARVH